MSAADSLSKLSSSLQKNVRLIEKFLANRQEDAGAQSVKYISSKEIEDCADLMFEQYGEMFKKLAQ